MKNIMLALAIGLAVAGCATSPLTMDVDYDTAKDFAAQKTFAWMPATGNAAANELRFAHLHRLRERRCACDAEGKCNGSNTFHMRLQRK